jgi:mRNA-degrading endonuclease RelE of RelBE toxin-antitoxin system
LWVHPDVAREVRQAGKVHQEAFKNAVQRLEQDPFPADAVRLHPLETNEVYSLHIGAANLSYLAWPDWPVIYIISIAWVM